MTLATRRVVTALIDGASPLGEVPLGTREDSAWTYAFDAPGRAALVSAVLAPRTHHEHLDASRQVYVWDRPCRSSFVLQEYDGMRFWGSIGDDEFPDQCLRLVFDQRHDIGAVHFCGPTAEGTDGIWVTRAPSPLTDAPTLYYDSDSDTEFPTDAVMRVDQLRPIVAEYVETGLRPECVDWQPFHRL